MWSGRAHNEGTYWDDVKAMDSRLNDIADVTRFRGKNYDSTAELLPVLQQNSAGKDWIIYRGHGGRTAFGYDSDNALLSSDVWTLDLSSRPVVLALACTTGDYAGGPDGIAEVFLNQGAAVFIGSVETSSTARNSDASRAYFNRWHSGRSVGWVLTDLMRDKWGNSTWWWSDGATWERWIYDYQLFGDPKYGAGVTAASHAPVHAAQIEEGIRVPQEHGFTSTLEVSLPDLEFSATDEGWDYVSLPEGDRMSQEGEYAVPVETINVHYPAGERVQDVTLDLRSGMEVTTGLSIPVTVFELDEAGRLAPGLALPPGPADDVTSWHPELEQPFRWQVFENADGSSDLQLVIYPFHYNPATTDARFYKEWRFEVHTVETDVSLEQLDAPAVAVPGDRVALSLDLQNGGDAQDVVVSAAVTSMNGEPLAGLPLRTLHGLQGTAGVDLTWDTTDLAAGSYAVEVTLADKEGHVLDSASTVIRLGDDGNVYLPFVSRR